MSCTLSRDDEEDSFEARLKLIQLIESMNEDPMASRRAYELCSRMTGDAPILFDCLKEQLASTIPSLQRIALIELLCRLSRLSEYKSLIADSFRELIETCNIKQSRDKEVRNTAKALKNLLRAVGEQALKEYDDYRVTLNGVLGMSEAEQRAQQQRQQVMEEIEKDRESHRAAREASWSRPESETAEDEFRILLRELDSLSSRDFNVCKENSQTFYSVNGVPPQTPNDDEGSVLIIHIEEALFDHRQLYNSKESDTRRAVDGFEYFVKRLAKEYFFYSDLRGYNQPHILYYQEDDDARSLKDYNFTSDPLAESQEKRTGSGGRDAGRHKFYRERAYRHRVALERYQALAKGEVSLDQKQVKECQRLRHELDRVLRRDFSSSLKALGRLCQDASAVFLLSDDHLSIVLARLVALDLIDKIPPQNIYSTTKFDAGWIIGEIKARMGEHHSYRVLGRSGHLERAVERSLHACHRKQFVKVRHPRDLRL